MKILCFGSLNIDYIYEVNAFVKAEETISSKSFSKKCGGKGLNQAAALAKAGSQTFLAGSVAASGKFLTDYCKKFNVDTSFVIENPSVETGHAIIQVDTHGQNCILLYSGANRTITTEHIDRVFNNFTAGDYVLLQNEINNIAYIMKKAKEKNIKIVFNPSPLDETVYEYPLDLVDIFIMNRVEGMALSGCKEEYGGDYKRLAQAIAKKFPHSRIVLTLGKAGALYLDDKTLCFQGIYDAPVVDSTGAGDTFTGYFISQLAGGQSIQKAMEIASKAAALAVTKRGATESIPCMEEVLSHQFK